MPGLLFGNGIFGPPKDGTGEAVGKLGFGLLKKREVNLLKTESVAIPERRGEAAGNRMCGRVKSVEMPSWPSVWNTEDATIVAWPFV